MKIKILPGEYIWSEQGLHVLDETGFARRANEKMEVEVVNQAQLPIILAYQESVRPKQEITKIEPEVQEETPVVEPEVQEETPVVEEKIINIKKATRKKKKKT